MITFAANIGMRRGRAQLGLLVLLKSLVSGHDIERSLSRTKARVHQFAESCPSRRKTKARVHKFAESCFVRCLGSIRRETAACESNHRPEANNMLLSNRVTSLYSQHSLSSTLHETHEPPQLLNPKAAAFHQLSTVHVNQELVEVGGFFESKRPADTAMGVTLNPGDS